LSAGSEDGPSQHIFKRPIYLPFVRFNFHISHGALLPCFYTLILLKQSSAIWGYCTPCISGLRFKALSVP
jgi:hypothetical protein